VPADEVSAAVKAAVEAENRFTKLEVTATAILDKVSELTVHVAAQNGRISRVEETAKARESQYQKIGILEADVHTLKNAETFQEGVKAGRLQIRTSDKAALGALFVAIQIALTVGREVLF
jgi:uncharacterized coiled-coil protein SlyX